MLPPWLLGHDLFNVYSYCLEEVFVYTVKRFELYRSSNVLQYCLGDSVKFLCSQELRISYWC